MVVVEVRQIGATLWAAVGDAAVSHTYHCVTHTHRVSHWDLLEYGILKIWLLNFCVRVGQFTKNFPIIWNFVIIGFELESICVCHIDNKLWNPSHVLFPLPHCLCWTRLGSPPMSVSHLERGGHLEHPSSSTSGDVQQIGPKRHWLSDLNRQPLQLKIHPGWREKQFIQLMNHDKKFWVKDELHPW